MRPKLRYAGVVGPGCAGVEDGRAAWDAASSRTVAAEAKDKVHLICFVVNWSPPISMANKETAQVVLPTVQSSHGS